MIDGSSPTAPEIRRAPTRGTEWPVVNSRRWWGRDRSWYDCKMTSSRQSVVAALTAVALTPAVLFADLFSATRALAFGSTGDDVRALQVILARDPSIYPEGLVTGYFGSLTRAAVRQLHEREHIVSTTAMPSAADTSGSWKSAATPQTESVKLGGCRDRRGVWYPEGAVVTGQALFETVTRSLTNAYYVCNGGVWKLTWSHR